MSQADFQIRPTALIIMFVLYKKYVYWRGRSASRYGEKRLWFETHKFIHTTSNIGKLILNLLNVLEITT